MAADYQPPQTARPSGPLVEALESPDRGAAFLEYMMSSIAPGEWWWEVEDGFAWVPYRTRHELRISRLVNEQTMLQRTFCASEFTVVDNIPEPGYALSMVNALNQRGLGGCAYLDLETGEVRVATMVELDPQSWFGAYVFEQTVTRLVGVLEFAADRLAGWCSAPPIATVHPTLGLRLEPDQFVVETPLLTMQPEAGTGLWWSEYEIAAFRSGIQFFVSRHDEASAATIEVDRQAVGRSGKDFGVAVDMTSPVGNTRLSVHETEHHELGLGLEFLLSTPIAFSFEGDRGPATPANETLDALWAVNLLNLANCQRPYDNTVPLLAGGWSSWQGQVSLSTYLPVEIVRMLQQIAANSPALAGTAASHVGGACSLLAFWHALRVNELEDLLSSGHLESEVESIDTFLWKGVSQNALMWSVLSDSSDLITQIADGLPKNELFEPIELDGRAWLLPHQNVPARFGMFNPMGPSVVTIEVSIDYVGQCALVLERLRHPVAPALRLHAVIDEEGFGTLGEFVGAIVARFAPESLDWFEIDPVVSEDVAPTIDGLRRCAAASAAGVSHLAERLLDSVGNPWARFNEGFQPRGVIPPDASADAFWIPILLDPANVDGHLAYLRSVWEGARFAAQGDIDRAQQISNACVEEIMRRGGTRRQLAEQ